MSHKTVRSFDFHNAMYFNHFDKLRPIVVSKIDFSINYKKVNSEIHEMADFYENQAIDRISDMNDKQETSLRIVDENHTSCKYEGDTNFGRPAKFPCFVCGRAVNRLYGVRCQVYRCKTRWHNQCFDGERCPQIEDDYVVLDI